MMVTIGKMNEFTKSRPLLPSLSLSLIAKKALGVKGEIYIILIKGEMRCVMVMAMADAMMMFCVCAIVVSYCTTIVLFSIV